MIENSSHVTLNYETRWRIVVWRHYLASKVHRPLVSSSKLQRVTSPRALLRFPWGRWRSQRFAQREWARRLQDRNWLYMRLSIYENFKKYSHNDALSFFPLAFFSRWQFCVIYRSHRKAISVTHEFLIHSRGPSLNQILCF